MTRRAAGRAGRALSLSAYVHRATVGLPKPERLDAAAELRAHLLERIAELEGKGFARDEAEFLAVQAMGDPGVTNRQLLGHFFTTPLGWIALVAVVLGGVGVWASGAFKPAGIYPSAPRPMDDTAINRVFEIGWPRPMGSAFGSWTRTADVRFPEGTQYVFAAWMSYGDPESRPAFTYWIGGTTDYPGRSSSENASYRRQHWQSRFRLVATAAPELSQRICGEHTYQSGTLLYSQDRPNLPPGISFNDQDGIASFTDLMGGFCIKDVGNFLQINQAPMKLNSWSKVYQLWGPSGGKRVSYALLLYATDQAAPPKVKAERAYVFRPDAGTWESVSP